MTNNSTEIPNQSTTTPGEAKAKQAFQNEPSDPFSAATVTNLFNVLNLAMFYSMLQYRVGAVVMICNKLGIMAGQQGGKANGGNMEPTSPSYRDSMPSTIAPTMNLPTDISTLQQQSKSTIAPPEYGDSQLVSISRSSDYDPSPIHAPYEEYKNYTGPPLAPHQELSRVITNYGVSFDGSITGVHGECGWDDITNDNNEPFLETLFEGKKGMPARDLRGATLYESVQIGRQIYAWLNVITNGRSNV